MRSEPRTYTFLFTDNEGSSHLWEDYPRQMKAAIDFHHSILPAQLKPTGGIIDVKPHVGDQKRRGN